MMTRPWGRMWLILQCQRAWVKIIHVKPGQRTSNQYHAYRSEWHWRLGWPRNMWCRVVPVGILHRMEQGVYIEFAWGHPHENDITRVSDDYGRAK